MTISTLADGFHPDLPADQYFALERLSVSGAKQLLKSPLHYLTDRTSPRAETAALRMGSALHCAVLEPEKYALEYATAPECDRRTKAGKELWAEFQAQAEGRTVLSAAEAEPVQMMANSIKAHPLAPKLITGGQAEISMTWTDPATGIPCKARADYYKPESGAIIDLKTCTDASPQGFARQALNFGYHMQGAAYLSGANELGAKVTDFVIVAIEKSPPYAIGIYRLSDAHLQLGHLRWLEACERYKECTETGQWPGYSDSITELELPTWAARELYSETLEEN
jgi:hypothetical protein